MGSVDDEATLLNIQSLTNKIHIVDHYNQDIITSAMIKVIHSNLNINTHTQCICLWRIIQKPKQTNKTVVWNRQ